MKTLTINLLIITMIIALFPSSGICNEPDPETPWPVAFSLGGMNVSWLPFVDMGCS